MGSGWNAGGRLVASVMLAGSVACGSTDSELRRAADTSFGGSGGESNAAGDRASSPISLDATSGADGKSGVSACQGDSSSWNERWQKLECEVLELTNQLRARGALCGGVPMPPVAPLRRHSQLTAAARAHAEDMHARHYFDHQSLDGRDAFQRIRAAGFSGLVLGENLAAGQPSAAEVVDGWMRSSAHCQNVMARAYAHIGIAYHFARGGSFEHLWVQTFGS